MAIERAFPSGLPLTYLTPGLAAFGLAVGFSHLASGDAFGMETSLPWAIELWGAQRHPTQIYEVLAAGFIFWLIWEIRRKTQVAGFLFLIFVALTALSRLVIEAFRGDSIIAYGSIRNAQLGSLAGPGGGPDWDAFAFSCTGPRIQKPKLVILQATPLKSHAHAIVESQNLPTR